MADEVHLEILRQGLESWNAWRHEHADIKPDLSEAYLCGADLRGVHLENANLGGAQLTGADLCGADLRDAHLLGTLLSRADLSGANLRGALLSGADLSEADLEKANLCGAFLIRARLRAARLSKAALGKANLSRANLSGADLSEADLSEADLSETNLRETNLRETNLRGANLEYALLVKTDLSHAVLSGCKVYAVAAWGLQLEDAVQTNLSINAPDEPHITVDNLEVAQFLYLMLHNEKIRDVIDTLTSKVVLILGRFTPKRKAVLDAMREVLRQRNYVPVLFDFEGPSERNFTETVTLLARMARFIIADLTEPSSIPQELQAIVPDVMVPVQPLLLEGAHHHSMFPDFRRYPWMLPIYRYASPGALLTTMQEKVIAPAEAKVREVRKLRQAELDGE